MYKIQLKKAFSVLILLTLVISSVFVIGDKVVAEGRDDVTVRVEAVWGTFNPFKVTMFVDYFEINQLYEPLVRADFTTGEIMPCLAESWEINEDGTVYTFKLVEGVKFHNGEELKASDVAFTLLEGKNFANLNSYLDPVEDAVAIDDYTCEVTLGEPYASFLSFLDEVYIVNQKFYEEHDGEIDTIACGTGPYTLDEDLDLNSYCSMQAFPDYWRGEAPIRTINFTIITDDTTAAVAYMAGEIDFLMTSASQYEEISQSPEEYAFTNIPTKHTLNFYMNQDLDMFADVRVRRALNHAVDKEAMIQVAFEGYAEPAYLQGDESVFGIDYDDAVKYEYDLEKAEALLTEAGYPPGTHLGEIISMPGSYFDKCAVIFQSSLAEIGYDIEIVGMDTSASTPQVVSGDFNMHIGGQSFLSDFAYAKNYYSTSGIGSQNYSRYSNERVDELFLLAEVETNPEKRLEYYSEIVHTVTEEAADIYVFHKNLLFAWNINLDCVVNPSSSKPYFVYEWSWK